MPRRRGYPTRAKRRTDWSDGFDAETTGIASFATTVTGKVLMGGFTFAASMPQALTLVRSRGMLFASIGGDTAGQFLTAAVGIGITEQDAVTAGAASLPGPLSDADWDGWLWHKHILTAQAANTATNTFGSNVREFEVDARAMRKFDSFAQAVFAVAEVTVNTLGGTTRIRLATRHLWKAM